MKAFSGARKRQRLKPARFNPITCSKNRQAGSIFQQPLWRSEEVESIFPVPHPDRLGGWGEIMCEADDIPAGISMSAMCICPLFINLK